MKISPTIFGHITIINEVAQLIARFLRQSMLDDRKRFSFETVFSHESNLELMQQAIDAGYKVYLYFIATESPQINSYRVATRVQQGGHSVPVDRIEKRYFRSLSFLSEAVRLSYQTYLFDNSTMAKPLTPFYHRKAVEGELPLIETNVKEWPEWFKKYYSQKGE